jgi:hypothetical protein
VRIISKFFPAQPSEASQTRAGCPCPVNSVTHLLLLLLLLHRRSLLFCLPSCASLWLPLGCLRLRGLAPGPGQTSSQSFAGRLPLVYPRVMIRMREIPSKTIASEPAGCASYSRLPTQPHDRSASGRLNTFTHTSRCLPTPHLPPRPPPPPSRLRPLVLLRLLLIIEWLRLLLDLRGRERLLGELRRLVTITCKKVIQVVLKNMNSKK